MVQSRTADYSTDLRSPVGRKNGDRSQPTASQCANLSKKARAILKYHDLPNFESEDDPKLLRKAIQSRPYKEPEPPILHAGFPLIGKYEAHCKSQIRSARSISPNRRPSVLRTSSAPLSTADKYAELKKICVGNRVADLELLLKQPAFDVRGRHVAAALADALLSATEFGFYDIVKTLLSAGVSPDVCRSTKEGASLHIAVAAGNTEMVKLLVEHRADVNLRGGPAETALKLAILTAKPDTVMLSLLLQAGARVQDANRYPSSLQACVYRDQRTILGQLCRFATEDSIDFAHPVHGTVLQTAAAYGKLECARILEDFGARFDTPCMPYGSPLHAAVYWGQLDMCRLALRSSDDLTLETPNLCDTNLLEVAVSHGHSEITELILSKGALSKASRNDPGHGKLLKAAFTSGNTDTLRLLLDAGISPKDCAQDENGVSVASVIANGHSAMACTMIDIGFDQDGRPLSFYDPDCSPMRMAARTMDLDMMRYLIANQAEIPVGVIQEAATAGHIEPLVYFAHQCRPTFREQRDAALLSAIRKENRVAASYLAMEGAVIPKPRTLLAELLERDSTKAARLLIDLVGQESISVTSQTSILCKALGNKQWDMAETLLDVLKEVRRDQHKLDKDQLDPLSWAISENNPVALKMLLRSKFDANACIDNRGNSPLCRAVRTGKLELVNILLRYHADPNALVYSKDSSVSLLCFAIGLCPLQDMFFGFQKGESEVAEGLAPHEILMALLEAGANVDVDGGNVESDTESNSSRRRVTEEQKSKESSITPLYVASTRGLYETVIILVKRGARFTSASRKAAGNAMRRALFRDDIDSAELLLRAGAEVDDQLQAVLQRAGFRIEGLRGRNSSDIRLVRSRASSDTQGGRSSDTLGAKSWQLLLGPMASYVAESMPEYLERRKKAAKCVKSV